MTALHDKGLRWSSLSNCKIAALNQLSLSQANYLLCSRFSDVNALVSTTRYVYEVIGTEEAMPADVVQPLTELLRLRSQSESNAKVERLFTPRDKNWIDCETLELEVSSFSHLTEAASLSLRAGEDAQKARVAAEAVYRASAGSDKLKALKEWTLISLFTCLPRAHIRLAPPHALCGIPI